jgi:DNA-binding transcriptional MocR family regulator
MSLDALRLALDEHNVSAVMCTTTFSNPSGGTMPLTAQRELVELCSERGIPVIDDDTYGEMSHDGERRPVCLAHDSNGSVVHVGSFSKFIAPGLRIGFVVPGRWLKAVQVHKITMNIASPVQPQLAIARLLDSGDFDRHRLRCAPLIGQAMQRCAAALRTHFPEGTRISNPDGGLVLWVEMPTAVDANALYEDGIRAKICVTPGNIFSARKRYQHHIRVNAGWFDEAVADGIARLGKLACHRARK